MIGLAEFEDWLWRLEKHLRTERGDVLPEGPRQMEYAELAVEYEAQLVADRIRHERELMLTSKLEKPRLAQANSARVALLLAYTHRRRKPLPQVLLGAALEALDQNASVANGLDALHQNSVNLKLLEKKFLNDISRVSKNKEFDNFLEAARLDGEADRQRSPLSESKLAATVGVSRKTVSRWREDLTYQRRRKFVSGDVPKAIVVSAPVSLVMGMFLRPPVSLRLRRPMSPRMLRRPVSPILLRRPISPRMLRRRLFIRRR